MMGGGGGHSTTYPRIPPQVQRFLEGTANQLGEAQEDMPISDFYNMDPRQVAGADPMQQAGYNAVGGLFAGGSPALNSAFDTASRLSQPEQWGGVNLGGVGRVGGFSIGGPPPGSSPGNRPTNRPTPPANAPSQQTSSRAPSGGQPPSGAGQPGAGAGAAK